ncbi:small G protein signaling modulator 1-like isoform X1 [Asterias rubens]|uniref:small G protein signaling modulator 1-like isoform X1 n=1 Tax=Asterias rubens TaxID=7604 RepID=UPI0014553979|nr:small G protein signaling modulator 1-like isoform X1 [Asterias rubens]
MATTTKNGDKEHHEKLIRTVKKEVKQIMEEAVTRKFVHEDSGSIISLCAAVDNCLSQGLKKRISGIFKGNLTTASLIKHLAKHHPEAAEVAHKVQEIEARLEEANKKISSNSNSLNGESPNKPHTSIRATLQQRYLWIRVALFEKELSKLIEFINQESSKYYEKEALMADPVEGPIIASLLVGPCALDYSKMKTADHYWTDPPADELVQRHRIHSMNPGVSSNTPASPKRPGLQVKRTHGQGSSDDHRSTPLSARDYVESLHQNSRSTLLYGKNNVMVQPKEDIQHIPGYLSLHQTAEHLTIKWTPNQLMNGGGGSSEDSEIDPEKSIFVYRTRIYWDYAVTVNLEDIVYLHCHQQPDSGGTLVLVGQDGVQYPPIHFPKGGHLLAFLTCLENGLLPRGQLDPPLWSQRGKGKVLPKLRRKTSPLSSTLKEGTQIFEGEEATDYVFRIIKAFKAEYVPEDMIDPKKGKSGGFPWMLRDSGPRHTLIRQHEVLSSPTATTSRIYSPSSPNTEIPAIVAATSRSSIKLLCDTMKKQIISRAFYGWLAHCRHLRTVRTHLSGLVDANVIGLDASESLTAEKWASFMEAGKEVNEDEVMQLVYFGGVAHNIRKEVWPYMLGHYKFGATEDERRSVDANTRMTYEQIVAEWMAVEAIIKQRDRDNQAAKLSSENSSEGQIPLQGHDPSLDSEVFELEEDNDEYLEAGEVRSSTEDMSQEQKEMIKREDYVVIECQSPDKEMVGSHSSLKHKQSDTSTDEGMGASIASSSSVQSRDGLKHRSTTCSETDVGQECDHEVEDAGGVRVELCNGDEASGVEESKHVDTMKKDIISSTLNSHLTAEGMAVSPASSNGGVYTTELLDTFSLNLHRVDKDVQRCDRNYHYFNDTNLEKLRNIMCSYVWEHLDVGYVQGMCDLVAPLLVIIDDEAKTYSCFCELMKRMSKNFPHGGAMDTHFANMRSLIQILDSEIFELMHQNGDYTHFYFCYRWFLLDFKRELVYDDTFVVWETIWAAKHCASRDFVLFIALALVEYYRDIILDNNMDFTDIIKFFNEMAERHDAKAILKVARELVYRVQTLIENK